MRHLYFLITVFICLNLIYGKECDFSNQFNNKYNHYSNDQIKRFKICGERCSGTTFLTRLIKTNFPGLVEEFGYGHKHGS